LDQTRRNVSLVDWQVEMPALLEDAGVHLSSRLEVEDRLLTAADLRLESLEPGTETAQQVGRVRALLEDCRRRHQELHGLLLSSRQLFLAQQARQSFVPRFAVARPEFGREILDPMLGATVRDV